VGEHAFDEDGEIVAFVVCGNDDQRVHGCS
jgi:hypothetical protein